MTAPKRPGTTPTAPRHTMRPGTKLLLVLVALFLIQVPLPVNGLIAVLGTVVLSPIGLGVAVAATAVYLFATRGTRR